MNSLLLILVIANCAYWATALPSSRIVGGTPARPGQYRFAAAIYLNRADGQYFCGGAIIGGQWILTAAQCVDGATTFTIQLGSNTLNGDDPNRQTVATVNSVSHPQYDPVSHDHDLALLRLHLNVTFNDHIRPIPLPTHPLWDPMTVSAIGWGQTADWGTGVVNTMNTVDLITISNDECRLTYGNQIHDTMVCVNGNYEEGTCTGDNGGPLIEFQKIGSYVLVGVNIFRSQDGCETIAPSGFVRTYEHMDWIKSVTGL